MLKLPEIKGEFGVLGIVDEAEFRCVGEVQDVGDGDPSGVCLFDDLDAECEVLVRSTAAVEDTASC